MCTNLLGEFFDRSEVGELLGLQAPALVSSRLFAPQSNLIENDWIIRTSMRSRNLLVLYAIFQVLSSCFT